MPAPSHGSVPVSCPCPACGWLQKYGEHTELLSLDGDGTRFAAVCPGHGRYEAATGPGTDTWAGLTTLHRNLVKERVVARDEAMPVIVKGADWASGCRLVDEAFLCYPDAVPPPREFTPVILSESGPKLSKTLIHEGAARLSTGTRPWMPDTTARPGPAREYAHMLHEPVSGLPAEPRHSERGYTTAEVARLVQGHGTGAGRPPGSPLTGGAPG